MAKENENNEINKTSVMPNNLEAEPVSYTHLHAGRGRIQKGD